MKNVVGKKCLLTPRVTHEAYEADNVMFRISSSELINTATPPLLSGGNTKHTLSTERASIASKRR